MLTEQDIKKQRELNLESLQYNYFNTIELPLDEPYELLDILERAQKALISDSLHLCLECTVESLDSAKKYDDANGAPLRIDTTFKQPCEGYSCKNEAIFLCSFTNKL